MISHSEPEFLPVSMKDAGAKQLCTIRSDLSGVPDSELDPKYQSKGLFSRTKRWFNCSYEVRASVGPADLKFELWYKGQKFSQNHSPIKITCRLCLACWVYPVFSLPSFSLFLNAAELHIGRH